MKSPYTHMDARQVRHLDMILLDGLSHCKAPATTDAVMQISDPRGFAELDLERVIHELTLMISEGYVERSEAPAFHDRIAWQITEKGRAHLIASETRNVIDEVARHTPVRPAKSRAAKHAEMRIEEVPEVDLNARLRASHQRLDRDGVPPAQSQPSFATVCIDEAELDDWWSSLNVQAKAELFTERSLLYSDREIATARADLRIPVLGTIGDAPETVGIGQVVETRASDPFQVGASLVPKAQDGLSEIWRDPD